MNSDAYKKYTIQARRGIKGEAFFESLVSDYSLPHQIVGPKDIGIDYICEWVYGDRPTGILYAVQVKTSSEEATKPKFIGVEKALNGLDKYEICNPNLVVDEGTLHYWKGLGMPVYLFAIVEKAAGEGTERLDCYYKRFTPLLTKEVRLEQSDFYKDFYKVYKDGLFLAFKDLDRRTQGFARDLFIDHVRWCYYKGSIIYLDPRAMGLNQFRAGSLFADLFKDYAEQICAAYSQTQEWLQRLAVLGE